MARINHRMAMQALPLTLACALVTSCALGKSPAAPAAQGTVNVDQASSLAARAAALGLAAPDSYVQPNQLQIKDANGAPLEALNRRVVGMSLMQLRRVPVVVAGVSGPPDKSEAVLAALHGHLLSVLITDVQTARLVLQRADSEPSASRPPR